MAMAKMTMGRMERRAKAETWRATRVRSNKTRGAQTLRRSPSVAGSLAPSGGFRKLEAVEANTLLNGALCLPAVALYVPVAEGY